MDATPITSRTRWPNWMARPHAAGAPWANSCKEVSHLEIAEQVLLVTQSKHWDDLFRPVCALIDCKRSSRGAKFLYSTEELETVLFFGAAAGCETYKELRDLLAGDRALARQLLGFDTPRNAIHRPKHAALMKLRDGVPSEATMCRHRQRFSEELRVELHLELERRMRKEHLETPELQAELGVLDLDGSPLLTHYTAPVTSKKYDTVMNERKVTAPDAGYVPDSAGPDKAGHGWNLVTITTSSQVPLDWRLVPLNASEKDTALELIEEDFAKNTAPYLGDRIAVLTADGGFHKQALRAALRRVGVVENIHLASHARRPSSEKRAAKMSTDRYPINGFPNWHANGHREITCNCGRRPAKVVERTKRGDVSVRVEGKCPSCGPISITSGDWYYTEDNRFTRRQGHEKVSELDWAFGNGFTFNDPVAKVLGKSRFSRNEGFYGVLESRFGLTHHKRWFRRMNQAKIQTAMTFTLIHAVSLEQRKRARLARSAAPPGLPLAA